MQDPSRGGIAHQAGHRHRGEEQRRGAAAARRRKPVGEVQDDAGKEPGLGHAQQEAHDVEAQRGVDEHHAGRQDRPAHHDARDPAPCAHAMQHHVAGNLEQEVADEEDARAEAVHRVGELQRLLHAQLGESDVDAVEIGRDVAQEQQRDQPPRHLAVHGIGMQRAVMVRSDRGHRDLRCFAYAAILGLLGAACSGETPMQKSPPRRALVTRCVMISSLAS